MEVFVGCQFPSYTVLESGIRLPITLLIESVDEDNVELERKLALYLDYFTTNDSSPHPSNLYTPHTHTLLIITIIIAFDQSL